MRKIKKINGFLVVKFNDREKREYEGTALGEYGVIDAEVYTGNLDIDRGAMEYDDADTLEVAVELARGLESEEDITDEPPTYTAAVETNESYTEEAVEPTALIEGWTRRLATQVKSKHYPDTDPRTAAHELYGFKMALHQIGFLPESESSPTRTPSARDGWTAPCRATPKSCWRSCATNGARTGPDTRRRSWTPFARSARWDSSTRTRRHKTYASGSGASERCRSTSRA